MVTTFELTVYFDSKELRKKFEQSVMVYANCMKGKMWSSKINKTMCFDKNNAYLYFWRILWKILFLHKINPLRIPIFLKNCNRKPGFKLILIFVEKLTKSR